MSARQVSVPALRFGLTDAFSLQRSRVQSERERLIRRDTNGTLEAVADDMNGNALHFGVTLARQETEAKRCAGGKRMELLEDRHAARHLPVRLVDRVAQRAHGDRVLGERREGDQREQPRAERSHSDASATPKAFFFSSARRSLAFAASSNSRFLACCSIFFSSAFISRASCFSDIAS